MDTISKEKLIKFSNTYPEEKIKVMYLEDIEQLEHSNNNSIDRIYHLGKNIYEI